MQAAVVVVFLLIIIFCSSLVVPSQEDRSMLYKVDEYTDRYWNGYEWVYVLYPLQMEVAEATSTILSDASDGHVRSNGSADATAPTMIVGD
ncbi:MAG: hypothetical protein QW560_00155, partial [Candidatus Nitrosocaldus sp.]